MNTDRMIQNEFKRNIGLLSEEEQRKLMNSRIAVAGAGGVGGLHVLTLARLGIGNFNIADPDIFEPVNINRQFGATVSTMGKNKAEVLAEMVLDINPDAKVKIFNKGVSGENVDIFLQDADVFIDGIDFFEIAIRRLIFMKARRKGICALTAAPLGFGATLQIFAPAGMSFDQYFGITDSMGYDEQIAAFASGLAPHPYHIKYMDLSKVSLEERTGPALSLACTLAASFVASEVVKIITGKGKIYAAPHYMQLDLLRNKFKKGYLLLGGKNPLKIAMKRAILWKKKKIR